MSDFQITLDAYALVLMYPTQDHDVKVQSCIDCLADGHPEVLSGLEEYRTFLEPLSLCKREELYIKTFDLNKAGTLDLGWHLFGEDYNRGLFLVKLRQHLRFLEIPETSELPDHVSQVMRILGRLPLADSALFAHSCVIPSIEIIAEKIGEKNPYVGVLEGLALYLRSQLEVPEGFEETTESDYDLSRRQLPIIQ